MSKQQRDFTAAEKMDPAPSSSANLKKKRRVAPSTLLSLDCDILAMIFTFLDMFDLVHCSVVCKFWNAIIESRSLREFYQRKVKKDCSSEIPEKPLLNAILGGIAMKHHKLALQSGVCLVDQWKGHSTMVSQCRMKMGMVVTGVGDKVIRLWSLDRYKCIEEYSVPDMFALVDFDFDEGKIVGLIGSRLCIWRRNGKRSIFPAPEGTFVKGSCMRYFDPEAVIGCNDGTVRVFDMYSRRCSQIIRMHSAPITCLCLSEDQLIVSGSTSGSIAISDPSSVQQVATLRSSDCRGIRTLCFNPSSHLVFAGSAVGYTYCWDLRTRRLLWGTRVSPNVIYSLGNLQNDTSTLAVGGIDGILRFLNQNDGNIVSSFIMDYRLVSTSQSSSGFIQRRKARRLPENTHINIDLIPMAVRPSITCLVVGMKKIVTTHNTNDIRLWKFK
ncbi:PREDICTED: F-box/WD-40 repeat-containing protein At3g52030 isoform X1 [Lupinus angustifolius]|uniref:F-box/WD-40 repeat-containing protein At3g52030 isoform X1 n=1 Tax=Lupinus angustifolius TaxID=3871 RepID=UPI00092FAACD|nr:PREDICTED: F-box/WD-40 repeat-containing protein At3g52030 isoform X1 [Lupinus angustifolius]